MDEFFRIVIAGQKFDLVDIHGSERIGQMAALLFAHPVVVRPHRPAASVNQHYLASLSVLQLQQAHIRQMQFTRVRHADRNHVMLPAQNPHRLDKALALEV